MQNLFFFLFLLIMFIQNQSIVYTRDSKGRLKVCSKLKIAVVLVLVVIF